MTAILDSFSTKTRERGAPPPDFARLARLTPRQVNNWARGRAAVPSS